MGVLYLGDPKTGEILGEINGSIKVEEAISDPEIDEEYEKLPFSNEATLTIDITDMDKCALLTLLYGFPITNNWLKMHGGVMRRKRRK